MQEEYHMQGPWPTAALVAAYAGIYVTQHHRFPTIKQKSCLLPAISSGVMSLLSLYFAWVWAVGTGGKADQGYFRFERVLQPDVDTVGRFGTLLFRSYMIGECYACD
jgi:hypothetical protein